MYKVEFMRYKLTIAYDGTAYSGWQIQPNGPSIQEHIQKVLETILRCPTHCTGSGRTDAGVHARGQVAHIDVEFPIDPARLLIGLNSLLPPDIRILALDPAAPDFHARYKAEAKIYHYHLHLDPIINPFTRLYRHHVHGPCDLHLMEQAIPYFLGTHDFFSFANKGLKGSASRDSVRTLKRLDLIQQAGGVRLEFEGDGFLYKMVRNIVGTLLEAASGALDPKTIPAIFEAKDRRAAPNAAAAQGLFLMQVIY